MILSAENLGHSYGVRTLFKNISFNIEEGDKIGVIGVNGTGKSTLLRDIATGEPSEGKITKNGTCVIEYLPQDPAFDPDATVLEQVFRVNRRSLTLCAVMKKQCSRQRQSRIIKPRARSCLPCSRRWTANLLADGKRS